MATGAGLSDLNWNDRETAAECIQELSRGAGTWSLQCGVVRNLSIGFLAELFYVADC